MKDEVLKWPAELTAYRRNGRLYLVYPRVNRLYLYDLNFSLRDSITFCPEPLVKIIPGVEKGLAVSASSQEVYWLDATGKSPWHFKASKLRSVFFLSSKSLRMQNGMLYYLTGNNRYYIYKSEGTVIDSGIVRNVHGLSTGEVFSGPKRYIFKQLQINQTHRIGKTNELWNFEGEHLHTYSFEHAVSAYFLNDHTIFFSDPQAKLIFLQFSPEKALRIFHDFQPVANFYP